jgi:hypothetical protein
MTNDNPDKRQAALAERVAQASLAVATVAKDGRNKEQGYNYAKAEDVVAAARAALLAAGLVAEFECLGTEERPIKSRSGTDGLMVKATIVLTITDIETGAWWRRSAVGYGSDYPGDKAVYKAMTGARKYALIHLLGIALGDDPEEERKQPTGKAPAQPDTIGQVAAKRLVDRAWPIEAAKRQLQLAAQHQVGRPVGDCSTKAKAAKALAMLNADQAQRMDDWITKKEREAQEPPATTDQQPEQGTLG